MLAREYWVSYSFSQFCRAAIEKLTENILEKRAGSTRRTAAKKALKNALQECRR